MFRDLSENFVPLDIMAGFSFQCILRPVLYKVHLTAIQDTRVTTTKKTRTFKLSSDVLLLWMTTQFTVY